MNAGQREEFDRTDMDHQKENRSSGEGDSGYAGSLSVGDYQRLRQGYERALSPEAREKIGGSSPMGEVQTSRRVVRIRPETRIPATREEDWQGDYRGERRRSGGRIGPIGVLLILAVGLLGGLVLYAGGIEYVNGLFGEEEEARTEDLTLVTERPGADITAVDLGPSPGEMIAEDEEMIEGDTDEIIPEENLAAAEEERRREEKAEAQRKREEEDKRAADERRLADQLRAREAAEERERQRRARETAADEQNAAVESTGERDARTVSDAPTPRSNSSTASGSWIAQVGATPDRAEADRIASRLRSRGGSGVTVITAEKNGVPIYRVRFGTFSSEDEARQTSTRLGFTDAWIIKR